MESTSELLVSKPTCEAIIEAALEGVPQEVCGVLGGELGLERSVVDSWYPAENVATTPQTRYEIDPEEQLEIFERLEDRGEDIVGFYHSHPRGPLEPSKTDVEAAAWPDRSYVIVSLSHPPDSSESLESVSEGLESEGSLELPADTTSPIASWRWRGESDEFERERLLAVER